MNIRNRLIAFIRAHSALELYKCTILTVIAVVLVYQAFWGTTTIDGYVGVQGDVDVSGSTVTIDR